MILNWKPNFMGQHARLQIIEREGVPMLSERTIKTVDLRLNGRMMQIEVHEENGSPYEWHPGLAPPALEVLHDQQDILRSAEYWVARLASHYFIYEVQL